MINNLKMREVSLRQADLLAIGTSVAWLSQSLISIALPDPTALLDLTMIVSLLLNVITLLALHRIGFSGTGKLKGVTVWIVTIAAITAIPGQLCLALSPISPLVESGDYSWAVGHSIVWGLIGLTLLGKRVPFSETSEFGNKVTS